MDSYLIYMNGKLVPESEAKVSVFDHGLLYGDGIFEGIRVYNGKVFRLPQHIDRLFDSAKAIMLNMPLTKQGVVDAIRMVWEGNKLPDAYLRLVVTRGDGDLGLDPNKCPVPSMFIIARPQPPEFDAMVKLVSVCVRRNPIDVLSPNIKSLNYLNNILAKIEANVKGGDEALMLDIQGNVSEGSGDNILIIKNGVLIAPPVLNNLNGITRGVVIELAKSIGLTVEIKNIGLYDVYTADEVMVTGTFVEIASVSNVDGRIIGDRPGFYTEMLMHAFKTETQTTGIPI